ncbi:MAG: hypothetical protein R8P61_07830 [Bacteroidia bacterium]|nr:hypothetical protein [Bacteroidia bacterium]
MKKATFFTYLLLLLFFIAPSLLKAQSYYGITDQGLHTISLSFGLEDNPRIGIGYNYRNFNPSMGNAVLDWQAEVQVSKDLKAYKLSAGLNYLNLDNDFQNSLGLGLGAHAFVQSDPQQDAGQAYAGLDFSAYPGYFNDRLSFAPKIGYRLGVAINSPLGANDDTGDTPNTFGEDAKIGESINLNHNHLYVGALTDGSFSANFPSRLSLGINADLYRKVLLDSQADEVEDREEGQQFWIQARISTSF